LIEAFASLQSTSRTASAKLQAMESTHLTGLTEQELSQLVASCGEPAYRARQIFSGIQARRQMSFAEMTDLPKELRGRLSQESAISTLSL